jgi:hypothetical protein
MTLRRVVGTMLLASMAVVCGGKDPAAPSPSPTPTPSPSPQPQPATASLSGRVTAADSSPLPNALVEIVTGANAGQSATAASDGSYRFTALQQGTLTIRATATGFVASGRVVALTADAVSDFRLERAAFMMQGRVFDAVTDEGIGGVAILGEGFSGTSNPSGTFTVDVAGGNDAPRQATFMGASLVTRQTFLRLPGRDAAVSLIGTAFDLNSFNQMLRAPILRRWTSPPPLLVERRTLRFADVNASSAVALDETMPDAAYDGLLSDLQWALGSMTGSPGYSFSSISERQSASGSNAILLNTGVITVARVSGLTQATTFWGYGRWQSNGAGEIVSGIIMLDRDFDAGASPFIRTLRAHELGHALGYHHVTLRESVMNSSARLAPNAFDLAAFRIAFQRKPGNVAPDTDPADGTINFLRSDLFWGPPIR